MCIRLLVLAALLVCALVAPASSAAAGDRTPVLIRFDDAPTARDIARVERAGGRVDHRYGIVPALAAVVPAAALDRLSGAPGIAAIEPDQRVQAFDYRSTHDWGIAHVRADAVHAAGNTGVLGGTAPARVAVLDSGIDCEHAELTGPRCLHGANLIAEGAAPDDDWGHGTHVAGTVAATLNSGVSTGVVGVAPGAHVIAYKVLDDQGYGSISDVIAAVDLVWNGGTPSAEIVNMSLGWSSGSTTFEATMDRAYASGMTLVAAAGNGGRCSGKGDTVSYPARYSSVIAVAAVDSANSRPCWSSHGPAVELAAPGVSVFSLWPANMATSYRDPQPVCEDGTCHYKYGSGTSMAVPHVAGAAALIWASGTVADANGANGLADEIRARLQQTAVDIGPTGTDTFFGFGLVDAQTAVGGETAAEEPPSATFTLSAGGYKVKGVQTVDLTWSGASGESVDIYRDGIRIVTTANTGAYTDDLQTRGGGTYGYRVCEAGTSTCSNDATVTF